jgi:hypothetical protein
MRKMIEAKAGQAQMPRDMPTTTTTTITGPVSAITRLLHAMTGSGRIHVDGNSKGNFQCDNFALALALALTIHPNVILQGNHQKTKLLQRLKT